MKMIFCDMIETVTGHVTETIFTKMWNKEPKWKSDPPVSLKNKQYCSFELGDML